MLIRGILGSFTNWLVGMSARVSSGPYHIPSHLGASAQSLSIPIAFEYNKFK